MLVGAPASVLTTREPQVHESQPQFVTTHGHIWSCDSRFRIALSHDHLDNPGIVGTALVVPNPQYGPLSEMWSAVVRWLGAARPVAKVVVAAPAKWVLKKRMADIACIIRAQTEAELDAVVLERQPRWRIEARFLQLPLRVAHLARRGRTPLEELDAIEESLYKLLDAIDATTPEDKVVPAEMLRVAAISSMRSLRTVAELAERKKGVRIGPRLSFAQTSDAIQTPLMYGYAALICVVTKDVDQYIRPEMVEVLARRTLEASDTFAGIVGSLRDDV